MNRLRLACCLALAAFAGCGSGRALSSGDVANILAWAQKQPVKQGTVRSVAVPAAIGIFSGRFVQIANLGEGRYCFLAITHAGYKDNFEGVLSCTRPLAPDEIVTPPANENRPAYISLPGYGSFEELYIQQRRDDRTYDVYFDLN